MVGADTFVRNTKYKFMAMDHLKQAILLLIILWFVWYFTAGPNSASSKKPFINPPAPISDGNTYGPH